MSEHTRLKDILDRVEHLAPVTFIVPVQGSLAVHLMHYAADNRITPETAIAEALRHYLGDA